MRRKMRRQGTARQCVPQTPSDSTIARHFIVMHFKLSEVRRDGMRDAGTVFDGVCEHVRGGGERLIVQLYAIYL